ncbi:hypothetical protein STEG23_009604 [Scotinomys teguina]
MHLLGAAQSRRIGKLLLVMVFHPSNSNPDQDMSRNSSQESNAVSALRAKKDLCTELTKQQSLKVTLPPFLGDFQMLSCRAADV